MLTTVLTILRRADLSETQNIEPPAERERWPPSEPPAIKAARACVRIPVVFDWWHRPLCRDRPGNANHATLHPVATRCGASQRLVGITRDRKSTRLNSSHLGTSYAVFCLKKSSAANSRPRLAQRHRRHLFPGSLWHKL